MTKPLVPSEQHRLAVELAAWLADQVRRLGEFKQSPVGPILDSATSPFPVACYALWSVDAALVTDANGGPPDDRHGSPPPHFRLADDAELRVAVSKNRVSPKSVSRLVGSFVEMKAHVPEAFELTAEWFRPSLPSSLLDAFVAAGFAERSGERCRWTSVMAQWVEWSSPKHLWESAAESEARRLREYGPIWKTMPPGIREKVVENGRVNSLMLVDAIRRFWDGKEWRSVQLADWDDQKRFIDANEAAKQIQRLLEAKELRLHWLYPLYKWMRRFGR